jgi:hypothetical protein
VGKSLTNWLLWAWWRVKQTGYCGRGGEFDKLVFVGVGKSLTIGYCGRGGSLTNWLLWAWGRV